MKRIIAFLLLFSLAVSCVSEQAGAPDSHPGRANTLFSVAIDDIRDVIQTKTVLTDGSIETKISSVTLAIYTSEGSLVGTKYVTSGFDNIRYMLDWDETFTVYALANMGDMCSSFPPAIAGDTSLEGITYSIPSYTSGDGCINVRGIPMAGKLVCTVGAGNTRQEGHIIMTRLLSKLQAHLVCDWPGTLNSVKIYNLNRTLRPFGISAATSAADILGEQEIHIPDAGAKEGDFLFYIPENRQGDISEITAPEDKSRDNDKVTGKEFKTYMEAVVEGVSGDGVNGAMTYRSYLGGNSSSDFNIGRNSRYVWNVEYLPDNLQRNDWKHENELSWKEFTYSLSVPAYLYYGQQSNSKLYIYSDRYENGVFVEHKSDEKTGIPSITYSVTPGDGSVLSNTYVKGQDFYFTGTGVGSATVTATCFDPFNTDGVVRSGNVQVLDFRREIFLRTPYGDYQDGDVIPIPFGTVWEDIRIGVKKIYADNRVETICPIEIGSDHLRSVVVCYPTVGSKYYLVNYSTTAGDTGKVATFSHTFDEGQYSSYSLNRFIFYCGYLDYRNSLNSISAKIDADITTVSTERIKLNADKDEACWTDGPISLTASSTAVVNGVSGLQTDITASNDYQWTATGSVPGMNPQLTLSGNTRILSVSKAGSVTISVTRKGNASVQAARTVTFKDRYSYRLNVTPKTVNCQVNDVFLTGDVFTVSRDIYVNGNYSGTEPFDGSLTWSVKSGSSSCLASSREAGSNYRITAKTPGTAYLKVNTQSSEIDRNYRENEVTVNIGQADNYSITISPASVSVDAGASSPALGFIVRNNGTQVAGLDASDLEWHTKNSAVATVSGGVVTGMTAGTTKVYATYAGAKSNEIDVTVTATQVVIISHKYKVVTTVSPSGIKVGQTSTASALRYKKTYVNDEATTDWVADGDVTSSGFADPGHSGKVSISGNTVTALATGSVTIGSLCVADEYENATLSISDADYAVSISPASDVELILGKQAVQSYTASATRNGNPDAEGSFEWSLSPAGRASLNVTTGSAVTVTAAAAGETTLTVNYKVGGTVKASASVNITVVEVIPEPLELDWSSDGAATYVAQRGLLEAGGLEDSSASVSYTVTSGADKVRLSRMGKDTYVALLAPGRYTIKATASNGQEGTFSGSVSAPVLSANADTFYANPDGSAAHTGADGLTGDLLALSYKAGPASFTIMTDLLAVGNRLSKDLYDELLAPSFQVSGGSCLYAGDSGIWVARLSAPAYPLADGTELGTVTISPKAASSGVADVQVTVFSVHPFRDLLSYRTRWDEFADREMISKYVDCESVSHRTQVPTGAVRASSGSVGWDVCVAGTPDQTMKSRFSYDGDNIRFQYDEGDALPHVGGVCEFRLTVTNRHSREKMACSVVEFPVRVYGAVGGIPVVDGSSTVSVKTGYVGPEAARPTYCQFSTLFQEGQVVDIYVGSSAAGQRRTGTVSQANPYVGLDNVLYRVTTDNGEAVSNIRHVYKSFSPGIGIIGNIPKEYRDYYEILNLEQVQTKVIHASFLPGWIIPDSQ